MKEFNQLINKIKTYNPQSDPILIELAYDLAKNVHQGEKRLSGEDYIIHPLQTAHYLADMKLSDNIIIAGLLHDTPKSDPDILVHIAENFGDDIAELVSRTSQLGKLKYRGVKRYRENLRNMFMVIAQDIRVVIIRFADRIHNLETLHHLPPYKQERIAKETLEIYAPIANRLGIVHMQNLLEQKAFPFAHPEEHKWVTSLIPDNYEKEKKRQLEKCIKEMNALLNTHSIPPLKVYGRTKQIYSFYQKLLRKNKDLSKVYDFVALRIIVNSVSDCYRLLGLIHQRWTPIPGRIKDYIAHPKPNGYQSLHTTIFDDHGHIVEIQIRTAEMHEEAEYGVAAHWLYKENIFTNNQKTSKWLRDLSKWQTEIEQSKHLHESLKVDVFNKNIFVFTPKGDVIGLPQQSTPIDFAYFIHTEVGNTCSQAKINDVIKPLDTILKNGDTVEIITNKSRSKPNEDWLQFVRTTTARQAIRSHAKQKWIKNLIKK